MTVFRKVGSLSWIAVVLFPLMVIITEVTWLYPWLMLIGRWPVFAREHTPLSVGSVVFLLGGSFFVTRFLTKRRWRARWARLATLVCSVAAILLVMRVEYPAGAVLLEGRWFIHVGQLVVDSFSHPNQMVLALVLGLYLWWRGIGLGRSPLHFENIYRSFSFGLLALVVLILAWGTDKQSGLMAAAGPYLAGFFFFGLASLALAKLQGMQGRERESGIVFNSRWVSIILVVIAAIVVVGIAAAGFFSAQSLSVLWSLFNLVSGLLFKVLFYFFAIVAYMVAASIYIVEFLLNVLRQTPPPETVVAGNLTAIEGLKQGVSQSVSPGVVLLIKWVIFGVIILGGLFLLARAILHRRIFQAGEDVDEIHESLWSWAGFLTDVRYFFNLIWQRFRGKIAKVLPGTDTGSRHQGAEAGGRLSIREVYQRLLRRAGQLGITRRRQETPYEYSTRLGQALPESSGPLSELTDLYVNFRYGDFPAEANQVDLANSLWEGIQNLLARAETNQPE